MNEIKFTFRKGQRRRDVDSALVYYARSGQERRRGKERRAILTIVQNKREVHQRSSSHQGESD